MINLEVEIAKEEFIKKLGLKDGAPGKDGKAGPKGEPGRAGKAGADGSPDDGETIVGKINKDKSGKVIKKEHVEGLEDIESLAKTAEINSRQSHYGVEKLVQLTDVTTTGIRTGSNPRYDSTTKTWTMGPITSFGTVFPISPQNGDQFFDISDIV